MARKARRPSGPKTKQKRSDSGSTASHVPGAASTMLGEPNAHMAVGILSSLYGSVFTFVWAAAGTWMLLAGSGESSALDGAAAIAMAGASLAMLFGGIEIIICNDKGLFHCKAAGVAITLGTFGFALLVSFAADADYTTFFLNLGDRSSGRHRAHAHYLVVR